uniref:DNA double-strand break repair nuclease NurA n=1 Tax=Ignisphaera aggregans TaxID=334771 RepID=A0A7J3Z602_9CREN
MSTIYPELAAALIRLREVLYSLIEERKKSVTEELFKVEWVSITEDYPCRSVAAVDSSFILIESRVLPLYAIQGISQVFEINEGRIVVKLADRFYDAGVMEAELGKHAKKSYLKKALTMYAYLLELKSMDRLLGNSPADLALLDGSLLSFMLTRRDVAEAVKLRSLEGEVKLSKVLRDKVEVLEKLTESFTIAFVAKSSSVNFYKLSYADFQLFELAKIHSIKPYSELGYSKPMDVTMSGEILRFLGLKETAIKGFLVTYVRLGSGSQVFQLSVPYIEKKPDIGAVASCIKTFSPAGYPLPLETVHRLSKLSRKTLRDFLIRIGIPTASGREILEI